MTRDRARRLAKWWFAAALAVLATRIALDLTIGDPDWVLPGLDATCLSASFWYSGRARGHRDPSVTGGGR